MPLLCSLQSFGSRSAFQQDVRAEKARSQKLTRRLLQRSILVPRISLAGIPSISQSPKVPLAKACAAVLTASWRKPSGKTRFSVDVAVLQLDLWSIRDALLDAHRRGVQVRMVTETDYIDEDEVQEKNRPAFRFWATVAKG